MVHIPSVFGRRRALDGDPEERQFEAETAACLVLQVARVVPPFGAELGMLEMIARELEAVARLGRLEGAQPQGRGQRQDGPAARHSSCSPSLGSQDAAARAG